MVHLSRNKIEFLLEDFMKHVLFLGICCAASFCSAEELAPISVQNIEHSQISKREIGLRIDPLTKEQLDSGLTLDLITETIAKELEANFIYINPSLTLPGLVLHIHTIQLGLDLASYFQLNFQEEAMLVRTRTMYYAATWGQNSILTCAQSKLKQDTIETVSILAKSFAKDYNKAMTPNGL